MIDSCIVVGAGIAGINTAETLRTNGFDGRLTVLSAERRLPYDRPPLSKQVLLDQPCPAAEQLRPACFYDDQRIDLRLGVTAIGLALDEPAVLLDEGARLPADRIVLATGGTPRRLPVPGADLPGVCTLRTLDDAMRIREYLDQGARVVVVGGGFIGTEAAAAAVQRGCPVTLVEAGTSPMASTLRPELAELLSAAHRDRGVVVRTGTGVRRFEGNARLTGVRLSDQTLLPADLAIVGIGMRPDTRLAERAGLAVDDGILVANDGRTSHPAVFAAGDVARLPCPDGSHRRIEHWQHAKNHGTAVAHGVLGRPAPPPPVPWFWSDQFDLNVQLAGHPGASDAQSWRGDPGALAFSVLYHRDGVVTGLAAVNRGKDVRPAIELIKRGLVIDHSQLDDPEIPVRKLLSGVTRVGHQ